MLALLTSGLLLCSGQTKTFDIDLTVDPTNKWAEATLMDSDGTYGSFDVSFDDLKERSSCLVSSEIKLCLNQTTMKASLELNLEIEGRRVQENGVLACESQ